MGKRCAAVVLLSGWVFATAPALADSDSGIVLAVPGRPDVPVFVNPLGIDASFQVVEGDFGLNKPAQANAHTIGPPVIVQPGARRFFFPHDDSMPGYGRYEIAPPRQSRPQHPQSINRSWGAASDPLPADTGPAYPMTISPYVDTWGGGRHWREGRGGKGNHRWHRH
jgi:hypothetical protein